MFVTNYALLGDDPNGVTVIAVADVLVEEETFTVTLLDPGVYIEAGGLLIAGSSSNLIDCTTDVLLPDVPDDLLIKIRASGLIIRDFSTKVERDFKAAELISNI